ncbi:hypothetical protein BT63DRAFT_245980 [Microthyrium microscopicum]|uniref:Uncharacterized protein n=1 Tax=Microthyrium microscopicum TaxID=703497 RepID=A0A6A6UC46_9PEZI|nr:hypothetical protein BT63DRAFT_245980 [Microthyrium microscopicum]
MKERFAGLSSHENIYTIPNFLTVTRLIAAPVVGYLILHDQQLWAVGLFAYAGITDLIDGWMARKYNLQTVVGSVIDPMADKALMTVVVICLAIKGALPLWLATLILGRDVALGIAAIYYRYASLPHPKTFMRYWDFSLPSAEVHPTGISKFNTFLQLAVIGSTLTLPVITNAMIPAVLTTAGLTTDALNSGLRVMQYVVTATTLWSGGSYVWRKDVVKILGTDEELKKKQGFRGRAILGLSLASFVVLAGVFAAKERANEDEKIL